MMLFVAEATRKPEDKLTTKEDVAKAAAKIRRPKNAKADDTVINEKSDDF